MTEGDLSAEDDGRWVADAKFEPNRPKINLVLRQRLLTCLENSLAGKLAVIIAPAGFGKSTLLCQWFELISHKQIKTAWLSLDKNDSDVREFLSYIAISLAHADVDIGELEVGARNGFSDSSPTRVLSSIMRRLHEVNDKCVLVLDDYHHISSDAIDKIIQQMIREIPSNFTLVINSRVVPSIDIPMLIASGEAHEISPDQLRLTLDETRQALGEGISEADAIEIYEQTEGWPVAVQLVRVQKITRPNAPIQLTSSSGLVASYLTHQVLATVDDEVREFLLTISVLEQFNPTLANAVRNKEDSWSVIKKLEPLTALLIPLDFDGDWFRLHHLFAEHLRETLRKEFPDRLNEIMLIASSWFSKHGFLIESVKYAALATDYVRCEQQILNAGGWKIILTDGIGVMRSLFRLLPDHVVSGSARLLVARAYLHCKEGEYDEARGLLDASILLKPENDSAAYDRDHCVIEALINAYEDKKDWIFNSIHDDFDKIVEGYDPLEAATIICQYILVYFAIGNLSQTDEAIRLAFKYMRQSGSVLGLNYCYLHAGVAALYHGDLDVAQANANQALELSESNFGSDSGLKHLAQVLGYTLKVWKGEAGPEDIESFSQTLSHIEEYDGWTEIYLIGLDAAFHLGEQCGELEFAMQVTDRFLVVARNRQLSRLGLYGQVLNVRAANRLGHKKGVQEWCDQIKGWMGSVKSFDALKDWQSFILATNTVSTLRLVSSGQATKILRLSLDYTSKRRLDIHHIRLLVSQAIFNRLNGRREESISVLIEALRLAARQKIIGPFLCDEILRKLLKETRIQLRSSDEELILINFVGDIIKRADTLRPRPVGDLLSSREYEILEQLVLGLSNKEIARRFELTENTVKFHLKNIYGKLRVNSRTQAIAMAHNMKLLD